MLTVTAHVVPTSIVLTSLLTWRDPKLTCQVNHPGQFKPGGMKSMRGSVCVHHHTRSSAKYAAVLQARAWLPLPSTATHHLLKEDFPTGKKHYSDSQSMKKAKCIKRQ